MPFLKELFLFRDGIRHVEAERVLKHTAFDQRTAAPLLFSSVPPSSAAVLTAEVGRSVQFFGQCLPRLIRKHAHRSQGTNSFWTAQFVFGHQPFNSPSLLFWHDFL
jgi:hypothetical protein